MAEDIKIGVNIDDGGSAGKLRDNLKEIQQESQKTDTNAKQLNKSLDSSNITAGSLKSQIVAMGAAFGVSLTAAGLMNLTMKSMKEEADLITEGFKNLTEAAQAFLQIQQAIKAGKLPTDTTQIVSDVQKVAGRSNVAFENDELNKVAAAIGQAAEGTGVGLKPAMDTVLNMWARGGGKGTPEEMAQVLNKVLASGDTRSLKPLGIYLDQAKYEGLEGTEKAGAMFADISAQSAGALASLGASQNPTVQRMLAERRAAVGRQDFTQGNAASKEWAATIRDTYAAEMYGQGIDPTGSAFGSALKAVGHLITFQSKDAERYAAEWRARMRYQAMDPESGGLTHWAGGYNAMRDQMPPAAKVIIDNGAPANKE